MPQSFGDMERDPLFFRIGDYWVLTCRQYVQAEGKQYSTLRLSTDGVDWSEPYRLRDDVDSGACLLEVGSQMIALYQEYPQRNKITRQVIDLQELGRKTEE